MAKQDYYATLGVPRGTDADGLKKAYRKLAMQFHPDRNPGDQQAEARFKDVNEAYDVLKDDQKRAAYDRFGHAAFEQGGAGGNGPFGAGFDFSASGGFGDIFEQVFGDFMGGGGRRQGGRAARGADLRQAVEIDLVDAFSGTKVPLRVPTRMACEVCNGTGSEDKTKAAADTCRTCQGHGRVRAQQGLFLVERTCPACSGSGKTIRNPCRACRGAGTVQRERSLSVTIPAGVEDGNRIRLAGEGEAGPNGAAAGDLYVDITVRPHPMFHREGANLLLRVPVRMSLAALGGEIEVPSIDGSRAKVKIDPGIQTGQQIRVRGKGFSVLRSTTRGDLFLAVTVETPQHLTKRQRELLEAFEAEATAEKHQPESEGFFARVKEFFDGGRG